MATKRDIKMYQGDDYLLRCTFTNKSDNTAANVTDRVYRSQIRPRPGHPTLLAEFEVDMTQASVGIVDLKLPKEDVALLRETCYYDIEQEVDGKVKTIVGGRVVVQLQVTVPDEPEP